MAHNTYYNIFLITSAIPPVEPNYYIVCHSPANHLLIDEFSSSLDALAFFLFPLSNFALFSLPH
jgi:hypothetical protein